jgi:hypothetical protein
MIFFHRHFRLSVDFSRMYRILLFILIFSPLVPFVASAGTYATLGFRSAQFAAQPIGEEPTPNYFSYGPRLSLGYSLRQVLDFGLFATVLPGSRFHASVPAHDARLVTGGGEIALRIAQSVYAALYGGRSEYRLVRGASGPQRGMELEGKHLGSGGGFSLGALMPLSKESFFMVSLDFEQHHFRLPSSFFAFDQSERAKAFPEESSVTSQTEPDKNPRRVLECFGVSVSYAFNSYKSDLIDNSIFADFLDSVSF